MGVAIVAVSVIAGARLLASADDTVPVWSATADLAAGATVEEADLVATAVRLADDELDHYLKVGDPLPEGVLLRAVGAGELLPAAALGSAGASGTVQLPVSVEPDQVPPSVGAGAVVDVYLVREDAAGEPVLSAVSVIEAPRADDALLVSGKRQLVLAVPEDAASGFFAALAADSAATLTVVRRG
ncbi:hypothetical protein [Nocardioides sp.]|uniref:hypothetical protein n=1 Tax=Nocardioides sp. TaxID=35761 RepID=UPI0039E2D064